MSSRTTIGTLDSNCSLNSLGGRAAATLLLHLTVLANGGTDALTTAHVDLKVSLSLTEHAVNFNGNSTNKVSADGATSDRLFSWSLALLDAAVFGGVEVLFWALFEEDLSSAKAFGVDVSLALLASTLDASVLTSSPGVTNISFLVVLISTAEWHTHTATLTRVSNSHMAHWTITAALSVTNWNKKSFYVWSTWARASGTSIADWTPELTWLVGLALELTEVEWETSSLNVTWASAYHWRVNGSSTVWAVFEWWLNSADAFDDIWTARTLSSSGGDWSGDVAVCTW